MSGSYEIVYSEGWLYAPPLHALEIPVARNQLPVLALWLLSLNATRICDMRLAFRMRTMTLHVMQREYQALWKWHVVVSGVCLRGTVQGTRIYT